MRSLLAISFVLSTALPAFAHRLHVDPKIVEDQVRVEVYYDDATPAQKAKVKIMHGDVVMAEGLTDDKGVWICAKPIAGTYIVRAESVGHIAKNAFVVRDANSPAIESASSPPDMEDRESNTRTPWRRLGMGIGLIVGIGIAGLLIRRGNSKKSTPVE
jgi:hypothetical protein